jgi:hypothetical protein
VQGHHQPHADLVRREAPHWSTLQGFHGAEGHQAPAIRNRRWEDETNKNMLANGEIIGPIGGLVLIVVVMDGGEIDIALTL